MVEDPLQSQRLKFAFESEKGLLGKNRITWFFHFRMYKISFVFTYIFFSFIHSFDASEQQRGQQSLLPVCEVPGHTGTKVSVVFWEGLGVDSLIPSSLE